MVKLVPGSSGHDTLRTRLISISDVLTQPSTNVLTMPFDINSTKSSELTPWFRGGDVLYPAAGVRSVVHFILRWRDGPVFTKAGLPEK
jgi:hypothetical protein